MPPTWSPEKLNPVQYEKPNEETLNFGYITPPCTTSQNNLVQSKNDERAELQIQVLVKKFPKLAEIFNVHRQIGEGTFSAVFAATLLNDEEQNKPFALKYLVPTTHPKRIQVELSCLKLIGGQDNVVGIDLCMREKGNIVFIMPYLEHQQFHEYVHKMDVDETKLYIRNLLLALRRVHKFGIIHRDVKPTNFLYDRINKKFLLIDFGLAQVCSSNSPLANAMNISLKRKHESSSENETENKSRNESDKQTKKRPALQNRAMNSLCTTVSYLQTSLINNNLHNEQAKENVKETSKTNTSNKCLIKSSPFKGFKSPIKTVSTSSAIIKRSPFKFTGLDMIPNQSKVPVKMPQQRKLFMDNEDLPAAPPIKFQKPLPAPVVTVTQRTPLKALASGSKMKLEQNLKQECKCYNKSDVCTVCLLRKAQDAPRAGTPGFRPPEVLLKYSNQTTAVDMWAVGVILLCILSGTYPFFRAPDDVTALAEIITIFGDEYVRKVAKKLGRHLMCSEKKPKLDLRKICNRLRDRGKDVPTVTTKQCEFCSQYIHNCLCADLSTVNEDLFPDSAYDLLKRLLDVDPYMRISAEDALKHPFLN